MRRKMIDEAAIAGVQESQPVFLVCRSVEMSLAIEL
jgi:hypothetical protein